MPETISLAIITKNRPLELARCLDSICSQNLMPNQVIVIDNDPQHSAKQVINQYQKQLKIKYLTCAGSVPHCRNLALRQTKTTHLAFTDDDCVLDEKWLQAAYQQLKVTKADYVLGQTLLYNPNSLIALAQYAHDAYWKDYSGQIFDTKNVLLHLNKIRQVKLKFDEDCQYSHYDSADFDFDFQAKEQGLIGTFAPQAILYHQEAANWGRFTKRAFARGVLAHYLNDKWQLQDRLADRRKSNWLWWKLLLLKNYRINFSRYAPNMQKRGLMGKLIALCLIELFEYYYTTGYVANKNNH